MDELSNSTPITNFVLAPHEEYNKKITISGNLTLQNSARMFGAVVVERGSVSLGDFSFISELYMPYGGEIFFYGKRPFILSLSAPYLTVHIPRTCYSWHEFVQLNQTQNVTICRDIVPIDIL